MSELTHGSWFFRSLINQLEPLNSNNVKYSKSLERIQVINEEKQFTKDLSTQIERWGLRDVGFGYDVVSIVGSQSTGKSTLLNRLFGTSFDVMDEMKRQQTTKGIWMCRGQETNVIVMDVEGMDGREHGEDQDFERKSALFSLVSSEVLLVNLWEHQVGLYQGANLGLLKTVFEVNLGLFCKNSLDRSSGRTLLLFVIRDHIGMTPLENLVKTLSSDLVKIWDTISKPEDLWACKLEDYFDISFAALPHKILASKKFEQEVTKLCKRFTDSKRDDFVFKPAYSKGIPADGVAIYMESIWEQVQSNKDLDLPTQRELLAQFRCDEIINLVLAQFLVQACSQKRLVEAGNVVEGLGCMMHAWKHNALTQFDEEASRYYHVVYKRKRGDLLSQLNSVLSPLFLTQLKNLHAAVLIKFRCELQEELGGESYHFSDVVSQARERLETRFRSGAEEAQKVEEEGKGNDEWSWRDEEELLRQDVATLVVQLRTDETKKLVNQFERVFRSKISTPVELHLNEAKSDMWDKVLTAFRATLDKTESLYLLRAKYVDCTQEEITHTLSGLRQWAWLAFRSKVDNKFTDIALLGKLRTEFEARFQSKNTGIPQIWKPSDDIDGTFRKAKDETMQLLSLFAEIVPKDPAMMFTLSSEEGFHFESTLTILAPTRAVELATQFGREADAYYIEAKRNTVPSVAHVPIWVYCAFVVLGWNEALTVLFHPLYFMMLIGTIGAVWIIERLNLVGPLYQITRSVTSEIQRQVVNHILQRFTYIQLGGRAGS